MSPEKKGRPAEIAGAGATLAGIVTALLAGKWEFAAGAAAGLVPAAVTYVVAHGGVRGVLRAVWRGR